MNELHKQIEYFRKKNGYTQKELANYLNISPQSVSKWEKGESTPNLEFIIKLSNLFMVGLDEFVMGKTQSVNYKLSNIYEKFNQKEDYIKMLDELIEELYFKYKNTSEPMWVNGAKNILKGTILSLLEHNIKKEELNLEIIKKTLLLSYLEDDKTEKLKAYFNGCSQKVKELVSQLITSPKLTARAFLVVVYDPLLNLK